MNSERPRLLHFTEDPTITRFEPHVPSSSIRVRKVVHVTSR
jgi:hypothetical protein